MKDKFLNLVSVLSRLRRDQQDSLDGLPDRIAALIESYNRPGLLEAKRQDIFNLINGSLHLAEALSGDTYNGSSGIRWATYNLGILCRIIDHLDSRPAIDRFGLLSVETGELHAETYGSAVEAHGALQALRRFGATSTFEIVPVKITSNHVVQPLEAGPDPGAERTPQVDPLQAIPPAPGTTEEVATDRPEADRDLDTPIVIPRGIAPKTQEA